MTHILVGARESAVEEVVENMTAGRRTMDSDSVPKAIIKENQVSFS